MKTVYMIGGTMGAGKTTTCILLKKKLDRAVFLDGDWCWDADPFQVTEETRRMVLDNICYLLNHFIHCTAYQNIIFGWVMHEQNIIDTILSRLDLQGCSVKTISLICDEAALAERLQKDLTKGIRQADAIKRSIERIPLYKKLETTKVDVSNITAEEAAEKIAAL